MNHDERIKKELLAAFMSSYGLLKPEVRHLPEMIHENEHIGGIIFGRYEKGSAVLVATDRRVLFLDYKPLVKTSDELSYDVVSGISLGSQGLHSKVVLHTRLGDYPLRYVNSRSARHFVKYIEGKQIEQQQLTTVPPPPRHEAEVPGEPATFSQDAKLFLASHELATFSSIDPKGNVHGAAVYYTFDKQGHVYVVTQMGTTKAHDVANYPQVAITITDADTMKSLQISGLATFETSPEVSEKVYKRILHPRLHGKEVDMPPLLYMEKGEYIIIRVTPTSYSYHTYK